MWGQNSGGGVWRLCVVRKRCLVKGGMLFFENQSRNREWGKEGEVQSCRFAVWGKRWRGGHMGHFQVPVGMVVRGGRRQFICHPSLHMSQRSILCSTNAVEL